jgi:hypothetical protein
MTDGEFDMFKPIAGMMAATGVAFLGVTGWSSHETEMKKLIADNKLSVQEAVAFRACQSQMTGKTYNPKSATGGSIKMSRVPLEICVCQSRTMVKVFKEDHFGEQAKFIDYVSDHESGKFSDNVPQFDKASLKGSYTSTGALLTLATALGNCSSTYSAKQEREALEAKKKVKHS